MKTKHDNIQTNQTRSLSEQFGDLLSRIIDGNFSNNLTCKAFQDEKGKCLVEIYDDYSLHFTISEESFLHFKSNAKKTKRNPK